LIGGVAIVYVGGQSELEMKEKKDRVEDALHATKAALQEGILPGGGIALLNAAEYLYATKEEVQLGNTSAELGYQILLQAINKPFFKILANAGYEQGYSEDIMNEVLNTDNFWHGFNLRTEEYVDMFEEGIIDPAKVTRLALENAASIAGTMLTTECVVSNLKEKNSDPMDFNSMM
jgi:chaperonin GroEL